MIIPSCHRSTGHKPMTGGLSVLAQIWPLLQAALKRTIASIRWNLSPYYSVTMADDAPIAFEVRDGAQGLLISPSVFRKGDVEHTYWHVETPEGRGWVYEKYVGDVRWEDVESDAVAAPGEATDVDEAPTPAERSKDGMHGIKPETLTRELKDAGFQDVAVERGAQRWFMVGFRVSRY